MSKRFGAFTALASVSFDIPRGQFFSVLGPSGCGKTTLLRLIAGFEDATGGRIRLDGVDVANVPPYRRNVNTVFQQYALFPHLSVFDNVAFGPRARGLAPDEVRRRETAMLEVVRLGELGARRPAQLSGGQRQRTALARALVNYPSALLLDEPLSALDLTLRQAMQLELKRIQREVGIAFVFVTHDQAEALTLSDRLAVMRDGRVEQLGAPDEVYHAPASAFVAAFIGAANLLPVTVEGVQADHGVVRLVGDRRVPVPTGGRRFAAGDSALVMVRPERVRLSATPPGDDLAAVPATIVEIVFQGAVLRVVVRDGAGRELIAHIADAACPAGLERGASIWAVWDPAASRLLPPSGPEASAAGSGATGSPHPA